MANSTQAGEKKSLSVDEEIEMMRKAPIQELADYLHIDLDLAVQLRVDQAVSDTYDKIAEKRGPIAQDLYSKWASEQWNGDMEITARPIEPKGNLYGFASVKIGGVTVDDFKIAADRDGILFVGMPSKPDKSSKSGYRNTVHIDKDFREDFSKAVLTAHYDAVERLMERAEKMRAAPDKPERMGDQMAKAEKEVERHNADLPKAEKTGKKREAGRE